MKDKIYVGSGGGYYGGSAILTVEINDDNTRYWFSPSGWDFDTTIQLEAAAICASSKSSFMKEIVNSRLNTVPVVQPTKDDIKEALFWLTGGNAEWYYGYWRGEGIQWDDEAIDLLLNDEDIMTFINEAVSSSNNFIELVEKLKGIYENIIFVAVDTLACLAVPYEDEEFA